MERLQDWTDSAKLADEIFDLVGECAHDGDGDEYRHFLTISAVAQAVKLGVEACSTARKILRDRALQQGERHSIPKDINAVGWGLADCWSGQYQEMIDTLFGPGIETDWIWTPRDPMAPSHWSGLVDKFHAPAIQPHLFGRGLEPREVQISGYAIEKRKGNESQLFSKSEIAKAIDNIQQQIVFTEGHSIARLARAAAHVTKKRVSFSKAVDLNTFGALRETIERDRLQVGAFVIPRRAIRDIVGNKHFQESVDPEVSSEKVQQGILGRFDFGKDYRPLLLTAPAAQADFVRDGEVLAFTASEYLGEFGRRVDFHGEAFDTQQGMKALQMVDRSKDYESGIAVSSIISMGIVNPLGVAVAVRE